MKPPKLDHIERAISGEPQTTPEQAALVRRVKVWVTLKIKRMLK